MFRGDRRRGRPAGYIVAGVHGCEYSGIAAVGWFMRSLDTASLSGSVVAVPIVSPAMFAGRAAFVSPADGKNPNRCFPGDPNGTYSGGSPTTSSPS